MQRLTSTAASSSPRQDDHLRVETLNHHALTSQLGLKHDQLLVADLAAGAACGAALDEAAATAAREARLERADAIHQDGLVHLDSAVGLLGQLAGQRGHARAKAGDLLLELGRLERLLPAVQVSLGRLRL